MKHSKMISNEQDRNHIDEEMNSILIVGLHLFDIMLDTWTECKEKGKEFHFLDIILEKQFYKIKEFLSKQGFKSIIIPYSGILLKNAAALAGIGTIGKNNLLLTEKYGPQVRLRAMLTSASLKPGSPVSKNNYCRNCEACYNACPANALSKNHFDKDACLHYNIKNLKKFSDHSSIWCNLCIDSCPIGKKRHD